MRSRRVLSVLAPVIDFMMVVVVDLGIVVAFLLHVGTVMGVVVDSPRSLDQFLWLSDLHLDPFYGTDYAVGGPGMNCFDNSIPSYGRKGCDSPWRLVKETIQQASALNVSFVIVTGDLCRHGTDQLEDPVTNTQAILANVSQLLRKYMPYASIIPAIGNNDVTPDYYLDLEDPMEILTIVARGLDSLMESDEERTTFLSGGFFARNVSDSLTILSLNTLVYSTSHIPANTDDDGQINDPLAQFAWLESQLDLAATNFRTLYIIGHIPPAMGSYRHSQLWQEPYLRKYYSIIQNHSSVIRGQFFGHLHADEFRWIGSSSDRFFHHWPLWIASSVTPIYGSNPSYRSVSYNASSGDLFDYDTFYLDLLADGESLEWKQGPSFRDSFRVQDLTEVNVGSLVQELNNSIMNPQSTLWQSLVHRQHVYIQESSIPCQDLSCRRAWICTLITTTTDDYATCLTTAGATAVQVAWSRLPLQQRVIVGSILVAFGIFLIVWCLCRFGSAYLRRRHYQQHMSLDDGDGGGTSMAETTTKKIFTTLPTEPSSSMEASYHRDEGDDLPSKIPPIT